MFDWESGSLKGLSELIGKDSVEGVLDIGGVKVWSGRVMKNFPKRDDKLSPLQAVVLKSRSLEHFGVQMEDSTETSFISHRALHIATNRLSWDLLIVEQ